MANYDTIAEAINADTTNMTVLRDHVKNDDSTSEYTTGIDWFKFNNVVVSNIYSSGNSWLGFGANSEQLLVNRRDCAVWDEYSESGMIGGNRFFKFKWCGVSSYNADPTTEATKQWYDVFLLDNGQIYLYFYVVPTSSCTGDNVLVCGNSTVRFTVNEGTPCEYTFKAADATAGTGWLVVSGKPTIDPAPEPKPTPTVVYNFLPGRYRAFVRTTYINGLNETKTCTSNAYEFSNNTPVITDAFMGTGATWDGSEVEIVWSGDYNSLTVQISNAQIVFKMYMGSALIYTFTSPVGTSTTDIDKISVGFLIDDDNEVAKPSFIYDNGNDTYQYNQEAPTDAEMGLIYEWLGGEGGSGVYNFDYTGEIVEWTVPKTGIYSLETWGAQGGNATDGTNSARGGYGAYAYGEVLLTQGEKLYINVGGQNGYGGGGNGEIQYDIDDLLISTDVTNYASGGSGNMASIKSLAAQYSGTNKVIYTYTKYSGSGDYSSPSMIYNNNKEFVYSRGDGVVAGYTGFPIRGISGMKSIEFDIVTTDTEDGSFVIALLDGNSHNVNLYSEEPFTTSGGLKHIVVDSGLNDYTYTYFAIGISRTLTISNVKITYAT